MNGPTSQIAALTIAGNHYLGGGSIDDFWPASPVFKFCKYVRFIALGGDDSKRIETPYTDDMPSWLERQKGEGVVALRLVHSPVNAPLINDRYSSAFVGGGGRRVIEALHPQTMDGWEAGWRAGARDPDRNIWEVSYGRIGHGIERRDPPPDGLEGVTAALARSLAEIAAFARTDPDCERFASLFDDGLRALESDAPLAKSQIFKAIAPMLPNVQAQRLLAASEQAWVFGGMGSWNDVGGGEDYERVSNIAYATIMRAIAAAANSTSATG